MKKNKMMRLASFLLIAVLVSTSAISGTYAKYVTAETADDTARVAKWGVKVDVSALDGKMFKETYNGGKVTSTEKVVAPNTTGTLADFTVSGTPEVAARVNYVATVELGAAWVANGDYYCPLVFKINGTTINGLDPALDSADKLEAAIKAAIDGVTQDFAAGTAIDVTMLNVTWEWPYSTTLENDAKDTVLGDAAADADPSNNPGITISIDCVITQID